MRKYVSLIFTTILFTFTTTSLLADIPRWFYEVSPEGRIGSIGYSISQTSGNSHHPKVFARLEAVQGLRNIIGEREFDNIKNNFFALVLEKTDRVVTSKGVVKPGGYYQDGIDHFEYLYLERNQIPNEAIESEIKEHTEKNEFSPTCDFENCNPSWLCNPVQKGLFGVPGISFRASTTGRKYEIARKNALDLIEYSLGVKVEGEEKYVNQRSSVGKINYRRVDFDVTKNNKSSNAVIYTKASCTKGDSLFLWQVSEDIPPYPAAKDSSWLTQPSQNGIRGSVGTASKNVYGFISQQLKRAYESGMNELSKELSLNITVTEAFKNSVIWGLESRQDIEILHKNNFFPKILGIYLDNSNQMFVWVGQKER